jgi:S-adenosylmethionine uptake transporter
MTTLAITTNKDLQGIGLVTIGIVLFSVQDVIIKQISGAYPVQELVFLRSIIALVLLLALLTWRQGLGTLRTQHWGRHFVRGLAMCASYVTYYLAIAALPLAEAVALYFVSPVLVTVLSVIVLKEKVTSRRIWAVVMGFGGTLVILRPGLGVFEGAAIFSLLAALFYAISVVLTRRMSETESGMAMAVYATAVYLVTTGLFGLLWPDGFATTSTHPSIQFVARPWLLPTATDMWLIVATGFIAAIGFYCLAQAYLVAQATMVAPFEYSMLILGILWGFLFWREVPDSFTIVGAVLIIASGLIILPQRPNRKRWLFSRR